MSLEASSARKFLIELFQAAITSVSAEKCVPPALPLPASNGRTIILAAGKAAAAMAQAAEAHYLALQAAIEGHVITRDGYELPCKKLDVFAAGHPIPDHRSVSAANTALELAASAGEDDLLIVLLSGGASALWSAPADGVSLEDKQQISRELLQAGAAIGEVNCVRKRLSRIKGGKLALAAAPAKLVTLAISDVAGDDPSAIGSGPTAPDSSSHNAARHILQTYEIDAAAGVLNALANSQNALPSSEHPVFAAPYQLVARPSDAISAAADAAAKSGFKTIELGSELEGEARALAKHHAQQALDIQRRGERAIILSGGEATVRVRGQGRGGPNQEFALALSLALDGADNIWALAADSDGTDGGSGEPSDPAGAIIGPQTLSRARGAGLDPNIFLENNDSTAFFEALGDLLITGPTYTNVNDFRAILINP